MSTPQIPPRPARFQHRQDHPTMDPSNMPKVPPRPARTRDRTQSPNRDSFPRSPLNEVPSAMLSSVPSGSMYNSSSQNPSTSSLNLPHRPPSVSLPSIGQEGSEYADIQYEETEGQESLQNDSNEPTQTRNVGSDLPLHAPRPSFSGSTAKARVSGVTRTDSVQAAAAGIGKVPTPISGDDKDPHLRSLQSRASRGSFSRPDSSLSTERPGSGQAGEGDHGIPEIPGVGQRVPMYPNAGDVQAPSPSPFSQTVPSGVGFHNQGSKPRHHGRTRSGREVFHGPPGSYGLHGHGSAMNADQFEKAWYDKHPEAAEREGHGQYGPGIIGGRGEFALSSEDLNKIVRDTANRGAGFGTSPGVSGLPNEQIGYMASEEYVSRLHTPPQSGTYANKAHSNHSQPHVESPLRKTSFPVDAEGKDTFNKSRGTHHSALAGSSDNALESETEDESVHIKAPAVRKDKITGNGYDPPTQDLGPHGGNTEAQGGWIEETGYGVPILASDEVAKELGMEFMQPAVSPAQSRRGSQYYAGIDSEAPPSYQSGFRNSSRSDSASNSRPSSRPGSIHGALPGLTRFMSHDDREDMHTPLEDVDEYEPLFPDEDGKEGRPMPASERFKRREMKRFPSQDIWEDTPNSLQLEATVDTPEPVESQAAEAPKASSTFETPEAEKARKGEVSEQEKAKLIPREERLAKSSFKPHLREEMHRPGMKQRFPSRDIWEDSPDSARLETTVGGPQDDDPRSPPDEGLRAGAVVSTSGRPDEGGIAGEQSRDGATAGTAAMQKPNIPPRPPRGKPAADDSDVSTQAVPSVPARPPKRLHKVPPADAEVPPLPSKLSTVNTPEETSQISPTEARKGPALPERAKPDIPPRPANPIARDSNEPVPLSKIDSTTPTGNGIAEDQPQAFKSPPPAPKPKPAVPSRPAGSKIAALKAGFLSDLDKRLQLGPQGPKPQEKPADVNDKEEEKTPLGDARKGRARGPARRKPAAPSVAAEPFSTDSDDKKRNTELRGWAIQKPWAVWQLNEVGVLSVGPGEFFEPPAVSETPLGAYSKSIQNSTSAMVAETAKQLEAQGTAPVAALAKDAVASQAPVSLEQATAALDAETATAPLNEVMTETSNSNEVNTPASSSSSPHEAPAMTDVASQTGQQNIKANVGSDAEQQMTAIIGGEAHGDGGDVIVRELAKSNEEGK